MELDVIQARALRQCLRAARTSPVCALQVEAGEMLSTEEKAQMNDWMNLRGHGNS